MKGITQSNMGRALGMICMFFCGILIGSIIPVRPWSPGLLKLFYLTVFIASTPFLLFFLALLYLYLYQETFMYQPASPIQLCKHNPPTYRKPTERGMQYEEITLKTADGLKL
jgi:hypothetical protein